MNTTDLFDIAYVLNILTYNGGAICNVDSAARMKPFLRS